jgi:hypothetical protein
MNRRAESLSLHMFKIASFFFPETLVFEMRNFLVLLSLIVP